MPVKALPELRLADLAPGDLILSRAKLCIPGGWESALIVLLDGGDYSHGAMFNGEAFIEMISAGIVKITPAAIDSPAEAAVWTMLFSRMFEFLKNLSTAIEITAAGIEAETVSPAKSPRYALAPARIAESTIPSRIALGVSCGSGSARLMSRHFP
jgi:hypothetical protein